MMFGNAEAYERFMGRWSRLVAPLLIDFAALPDTGSVLEIGSGIGTLAFEIARSKGGLHVTGIDRSRDFVDHAIATNSFPDRISFHVGDAQNLHFEDATFVACLSLLVFNFIPDPEKALQEVRRVTRPGSWISAGVWDYGGHMRMLRVFWDAAVEVDPDADRLDERRMRLCRPGELAQLWKRSSLENIREQALNITMTFDSFADYWDPFLFGQGPAGAYLSTVQSDRLAALRGSVKRRLSISSETDSFAFPARVWAVRGMVPVIGDSNEQIKQWFTLYSPGLAHRHPPNRGSLGTGTR